MQAKALSIYMGKTASECIASEGWQAEQFDLLVGASGGAKWLILAELDRLLFGDFLARSEQPISAIGSSIGSWRHACLAQPDPVAAINRMQEGYIYQSYSSPKPSAREVGDVSRKILEQVLGEEGTRHIAHHPRIHSHIVTARGRGGSAAASGAALGTGMGIAALSNTLSRRLLPLHFQRVVFHTGEAPRPHLHLSDFATHFSPLIEDNVAPALLASGSIPFVLPGERDIPGAPKGQYWDGGIIDYHFDLGQYHGEGLILYPHFSANVVPGWFDKFLPWRRAAIQQFDRLVLICPSAEFIADLPHQKIPDRSDFNNLGVEERIRYWETSIERSTALAAEFAELILSDDPLRGVTVME
jgi:Patatin-like phospholipase